MSKKRKVGRPRLQDDEPGTAGPRPADAPATRVGAVQSCKKDIPRASGHRGQGRRRSAVIAIM